MGTRTASRHTVAGLLAGLPPARRKELCAYGDAAQARRLRDGFKAAGKKLDMGKSCIRFQSADDLALDALAGVIAAMPVDRWIAIADAARRR